MYKLARLQHVSCNLCAIILSRFGSLYHVFTRPLTQFLSSEKSSKRVLFVCKGNICRSPYAEAKLRATLLHKGISGISISSAGFAATSGKSANEVGIAVAHLRGIDLCDHKTKELDSATLNEADIIFLMDPSHRKALIALAREHALTELQSHAMFLGALGVPHGEPLIIEDPYGRGKEAFEKAFDSIDIAIEEFVERIANG